MRNRISRNFQFLNDTSIMKEMFVKEYFRLLMRNDYYKRTKHARNFRVCLMAIRGKTFKEIGERVGVCTERARDIARRYDRRIDRQLSVINGVAGRKLREEKAETARLECFGFEEATISENEILRCPLELQAAQAAFLKWN